MRERITARVLLFDPDGRILLMKGRLPSRPDAPGAWFTVGGGVEPGESIIEAAAREVHEETGIGTVDLGPVVWRRESVLALAEGDVLFKESYLIGRCAGGEPRRDGWNELERRLVDDIRWWTFDEILATDEPIYPERFAELLGEIVAGRHPTSPCTITVAPIVGQS
jgi:8-oxo-dGTP pyrophosphatase MutT (NUDIX family)